MIKACVLVFYASVWAFIIVSFNNTQYSPRRPLCVIPLLLTFNNRIKKTLNNPDISGIMQ